MGGKVFSRVGAQRDFWVLMSDTASFSDRIHAQVNKANKKKHWACENPVVLGWMAHG